MSRTFALSLVFAASLGLAACSATDEGNDMNLANASENAMNAAENTMNAAMNAGENVMNAGGNVVDNATNAM